jgi:ABC-type nickel/cobalt efflux system permease component RcnA
MPSIDALLHNQLMPLGALGLGMLHMLEPGHGKLAIVTYVLQHRLPLIHTLGFGVVAGVSHSMSILFVLGVALWLTHFFPRYEGVLMQGLQATSCVLILAVALYTVWQSFRPTPTEPSPHCSHACHTHDIGRVQLNDDPTPLRPLYVLAWASGMRPCPRTLAILLMLLHASYWQLNTTMVEYCLLFSIGMGLVVCLLTLIVKFSRDTLLWQSYRLKERQPHLARRVRQALSLILLACALAFCAVLLTHPPAVGLEHIH